MSSVTPRNQLINKTNDQTKKMLLRTPTPLYPLLPCWKTLESVIGHVKDLQMGVPC